MSHFTVADREHARYFQMQSIEFVLASVMRTYTYYLLAVCDTVEDADDALFECAARDEMTNIVL